MSFFFKFEANFLLFFKAEETPNYVKCHYLSEIHLFLTIFIYHCAPELYARGMQSPTLCVLLQLQLYSQHGQHGINYTYQTDSLTVVIRFSM